MTAFDRRAALRAIASGTGAGMLAGFSSAAPAQPGSPPDPPRELTPNGADMGSLFPDVERLVAYNTYPSSFLSNRFPSIAEYRNTGRKIVRSALGYQPPLVSPDAQVVDRQDLGDFVRERVLFSTSADFRVPAYVHIPKGIKGRAPAIVDLHSHGGMFLFGKEKVIDFGKNHPAMVEYHQRNYDGRPTATALVRRGYVVITIDAFMFGERRILLDADQKYGWDRDKYDLDAVKHLNQQCRGKESTIVKGLTFAGLTWPGIV